MKELFWRTWALLLVLSLFWLGWAIRSAPAAVATGTVPDAIRAKSFIVVDDKGVKRAWLGVSPAYGTPELALYDAKGGTRASLSMGIDGRSVLSLYDAQGADRAALAVLSDGLPSLFLWDAQGGPRCLLGLSSDDSPGLSFAGAQQEGSASFGIGTDGPHLKLYGSEGKVLFSKP